MCECCSHKAQSQNGHLHIKEIASEKFTQLRKKLINLPGVTGVEYIVESEEIKVNFDQRIVGQQQLAQMALELLA
ncbi:MAG: hypothetical protein M0021_12920 [Clostridia bacterium]|nr:hypothetical protein [Clostridia bacterium]